MNGKSRQNLNGLLSLSEASRQTGYHQDYLGFLCRQGKLKGFKIGRNWAIAKADLDHFIQNYKNGVPEIVDESGSKIKVHTEKTAQEGLKTQGLNKGLALASPIPNPISNPAVSPDLNILSLRQAQSGLKILDHLGDQTRQPLATLKPEEQQAPNQLIHLKSEVLGNLDSRIRTLAESLGKIEEQEKSKK